MAFSNKYFGSTITHSGGSFLHSKAALHIEEGYLVGSSRYALSLGEYEVESMDLGGWKNQELTLTATSPAARLKYNNLAFSKRLKNSFHYFTQFTDAAEFSQDFVTGGDATFAIGSSGLLINNLTGTNSDIMYSAKDDIGDFRMVAKIRGTGFNKTSTLIYLSLATKAIDAAANSSIKYEMRLFSTTGTSHNFQLVARTGLGGTVFANFPFPLANNTNYWIMATRKDSLINGFISTDGVNYTLGISVGNMYVDSFLTKGSFGVGAFAPSGASFTINSIEFDELGTYLTTERFNKKVLGFAGVYQVETDYKASGFSNDTFVRTSGTSAVLGASNNLYLINGSSVTGASMAYVRYTGLSFPWTNFSDFVATAEMYGPSISAGWFVGEDSNYYAQIFRSGVNRTVRVSSSGTTFANNIFLNYDPNQWNRLAMVKSGVHLRYYVNGVLANAVYGVSFTDRDDVDIGFVMNKELVSGATVEFRNFQVSTLDQLIDDTTIDTNQPLAASFDRFNSSVQRNYGNYRTRLFMAKQSSDQIVIDGVDNFIISDPYFLSNTGYNKKYTLKNQNSQRFVVNEKIEVVRTQIDSYRSEFTDDDNFISKDDMEVALNAQMLLDDISTKKIVLETLPILQIENLDKILLKNYTYGASKAHYVLNHKREYFANDGTYRQLLTLGEY